MRVLILVVAKQPWGPLCHPPEGVHVPAARNELGQGAEDSSSTVCSFLAACLALGSPLLPTTEPGLLAASEKETAN